MTALAVALAGCGGGGKDDRLYRSAVDSFNAGSGPLFLQDFVKNRGAIVSCRLTPNAAYKGQVDLVVTVKGGYWSRATIDPTETTGVVTTEGGSLDAKGEAELRSRGKACRVSPAGSLSLAA